jgi:hypothetical protein
MGLFKRSKTESSHRVASQGRSATITHHAKWISNGATFYINPDGVTWSYDQSFYLINDKRDTEAALSQLERAYHLNVTFPDAEESIMSFLRQVNPEIPDSAVPYYDWTPPLPGS